MSAPVARTPRTPGGSSQGTRQQLDELDALLQRMLTLPVSQTEEPTSVAVAPEEEMPAEEEWTPPPQPRAVAPAPRIYEPAPRPSPAPPPFQPQQPAPRPAPQPPLRSYPASYMVIETATPPYFDLRDETNDPGLGPRMVGTQHHQLQPIPYSFPPVPGGQHHLIEDTPDDPIAEAARAQLAMPNEGEWVPLQSSWQPSAQTWKPLAETWEHSRDGVPPRPTLPEPPMMPTPPRPTRETPDWRNNVIPPPPPGYEEMQRGALSAPKPMSPVAPVAAPVAPPALPAPAPRTPLVLAPVVWFNKGFDLMLLPFGPLGRWFRGQSGRTFLGTMGLLCLAGAIVLAVVEGFGWTR